MKQLIIKSVLELIAILLVLIFLDEWRLLPMNSSEPENLLLGVSLFLVLVIRFRFMPNLKKNKKD